MSDNEKIERSSCGSGGCVTCPFSCNEHAEQAQNYGCLPSPFQIIEMKRKSGHNWACHSNENVLCGGFAKFIKDECPDLDIHTGNLISYETWYHQGEEAAIEKGNN